MKNWVILFLAMTGVMASQAFGQMEKAAPSPEKVVMHLMGVSWPVSLEAELREIAPDVRCDTDGCEVKVAYRTSRITSVPATLKVFASGHGTLSRDSGLIQFLLDRNNCLNLKEIALLAGHGLPRKYIGEHGVNGSLVRIPAYRVFGRATGQNADSIASYMAVSVVDGCYYSLILDMTGKQLKDW